MKKRIFYPTLTKTLLIAAVLACGCQTSNHVTFDSSYTSNKNWLEIVSDKKDFEGKQVDSCYKLNLKFLPEEAQKRVATDFNCITRCCWRSDTPELTINLNYGLEDELYKYGRALKYSPEKITVKVKYAKLLNTNTASVTPSGAIDRNGRVKLKYTEVTDTARLKVLEERELGRQEAASAAAITSSIRNAEAQRLEEQRIAQMSMHYNFKQSIDYVKLFRGQDIDNYLMALDKEQESKGYVLLLGPKNWEVQEKGAGVYGVNCTLNAQRGKTQNTMKPYPLKCGNWEVDLSVPAVSAKDKTAVKISAAN
ncbi:ribosomal protein S6E (S10) [Elusimicrobium posterum]|uniref:hypothetical protein n=1 Tax=Elusimicrobium posterum TaxID=3116653 RepID=UPI003C746749